MKAARLLHGGNRPADRPSTTSARTSLVSSHDLRDFTIGVEEEYQLVDPTTGKLRNRAGAVLESDWTGEIREEMQQTTVEVGTRVCASAEAVRTELARLRMQASVAAESRGLRVVAAGLHPFTHWEEQEFTRNEVYDRIRAEYRRLADSQNIFGLHVHVAVPAGIDRVRLMNVLRHHLPLVLALSGSSPFYLGQETGYNSYRSILWGRWPRTGAPPRFPDQAAYDSLVQQLMETGRIDGPGRIYWAVRPHHLYPTLEFRVADVTPRIADAVAIATLLRALTYAGAAGLLHDDEAEEAVVLPFMSENLWLAARDGIDAELVFHTPVGPRVMPVRERLAELTECVRAVADDADDAVGWAALETLAGRGGAANQIRTRLEEGADERQLMSWLADETLLGAGLDRRTETRDAR
jgi:glutamate---cysteine ligase / carboxylate-amine ligase